jgi:hypothetical protein
MPILLAFVGCFGNVAGYGGKTRVPDRGKNDRGDGFGEAGRQGRAAWADG